MGPAQLSTQRVDNRVGQEEGPHVKEIGTIISLPEFGPEPLREAVDDAFAVVGLFLPRLLFLDDGAADFPARLDHGDVDRLPGAVLGRGEDLADLIVEGIEATIGHPTSRLAGMGRWR